MGLVKFIVRRGNLEVRSCSDKLLSDGAHPIAEAVQWKGDSCYTIGYWTKDNKGFNFQFVDSSLLDNRIQWDWFRMLLKFGQNRLNEYWNDIKED